MTENYPCDLHGNEINTIKKIVEKHEKKFETIDEELKNQAVKDAQLKEMMKASIKASEDNSKMLKKLDYTLNEINKTQQEMQVSQTLTNRNVQFLKDEVYDIKIKEQEQDKKVEAIENRGKIEKWAIVAFVVTYILGILSPIVVEWMK